MKYLGIDLETNSFDKDTTFITELAAVLWDSDMGPVKMISKIVNHGAPVSDEAAEYTGITTDMITAYGIAIPDVLEELKPLYNECDWMVAHNGLEFDKPVLNRHIKQLYQGDSRFSNEAKPWIDTMIDIPFPANCKSRNLTYLQAFHGFAYPGHRAIFDVMAMFRVMFEYDMEEIIRCASTPIKTAIAQFQYPKERNGNYAAAMEEFNKIKDAVKGMGFRWAPDKKHWILKAREARINEMDFPCKVIIK